MFRGIGGEDYDVVYVDSAVSLVGLKDSLNEPLEYGWSISNAEALRISCESGGVCVVGVGDCV